jgi:GNAT superfamily N-acetyltransferase
VTVVSTYDRPDLVPAVAQLCWEEFWRDRGRTMEEAIALVGTTVTPFQLPRTFVALEEDVAVGTASLVARDLEERPDLTPWIAAVVVAPHARGRGHASALVRAVEEEALGRGVSALWLYTRSAETLYARLGWRTIEAVEHRGKVYALMRRDLSRGE